MSFQILGTGSALPACRKTNDDLSQLVDTSDEWITTRTGIKERRILTTETVTEIAVTAAKNALDNSGIAASELDYIICPTLVGDYMTPSLPVWFRWNSEPLVLRLTSTVRAVDSCTVWTSPRAFSRGKRPVMFLCSPRSV